MESIEDKRIVPKASWRILAFIFLVAGWVIVRLLSELNDVGWQSGFYTYTLLLGAIPASIGLLVIIFTQSYSNQKLSSLFVLLAPIISFTVINYFILKFIDEDYVNSAALGVQIILSLILIMLIFIKR